MHQGKPNSVGISALPLIALVAALCATLACARANALLNPKTAAESLIAGQEAYSAGDYDQAIAALTAALASDPQMAAAYAARGDVYYLTGSYELAVDDYTQAIALGFTPPAQALTGRGDAYRAIVNYADSNADYSDAYYADPDYRDNLYPQRVAAFTQAIEQHPDLAAAYYARGAAEFMLLDFEAAVADFTAAIDRGHEPAASTLYWRATTYYALEQYPEALTDFDAAIALDPASPEIISARGHAYIRSGEYDLGLADLETAIDMQPDYAVGFNEYCWFGSLLGHAAEVLDACERAVALAPGIPAYADSRGLARALTGDYAGAAADFQHFLDFLQSRGQDDPDRAYWISELEAGRNPFDEATLQAMLGN